MDRTEKLAQAIEEGKIYQPDPKIAKLAFKRCEGMIEACWEYSDSLEECLSSLLVSAYTQGLTDMGRHMLNKQEKPKRCVIQGIEVPYDFTTRYITSDFEDVAAKYPQFADAYIGMQPKGATLNSPPDFRQYTLHICKFLQDAKIREGRNADTWFSRIIEHYGVMRFNLWAIANQDELIEIKKKYEQTADEKAAGSSS